MGIKNDQAALLQSIGIGFQKLNYIEAANLREWTVEPQLNDAGKSSPAQCEHAAKIQILRKYDAIVGAGIIPETIVRIANIANLGPVLGGELMGLQKRNPTRRQIFVDYKNHEATRSCVSVMEQSAANVSASLIDSSVR